MTSMLVVGTQSQRRGAGKAPKMLTLCVAVPVFAVLNGMRRFGVHFGRHLGPHSGLQIAPCRRRAGKAPNMLTLCVVVIVFAVPIGMRRFGVHFDRHLGPHSDLQIAACLRGPRSTTNVGFFLPPNACDPFLKRFLKRVCPDTDGESTRRTYPNVPQRTRT